MHIVGIGIDAPGVAVFGIMGMGALSGMAGAALGMGWPFCMGIDGWPALSAADVIIGHGIMPAIGDVTAGAPATGGVALSAGWASTELAARAASTMMAVRVLVMGMSFAKQDARLRESPARRLDPDQAGRTIVRA